MSRRRLVAFTTVCLLAVLIAAGGLAYGAQRLEDRRRPTADTRADTMLDVATVRSGPHIVFRSMADGPTYGYLAVVPLDRPDGPRAVTNLTCVRVYATRAGGLCLTDNERLIDSYMAVILDRALAPRRELPIVGVPSRARLSPTGAFTSVTTFVEGHSYADGGFSTATTLHDTRSGTSLGNLEEFGVVVDGKRYSAADINVWGVTFADEDRFYATIASRGRTWLAEGDLARREMRTLRDGVECPSLSPDGTRVAYKKRTGSQPMTWRLHVLDLRTGHDVALAETRNVDDQAEWLDNDRVAYGMARQVGNSYVGDETDVWVVPADGSGQPRVLVPRAWSPAVVR